MEEKNKNIFKSYPKAVLILLAVMVILFGGFVFITTSQPHYTRFTENRTERMENRFSITVTDNIKLREYEMSECGKPDSRPEFKYCLCLETDDIEKFMTENVSGTITRKYNNMNFEYRNTDNQVVHAEVCKTDSRKNYSITLVIVDL